LDTRPPSDMHLDPYQQRAYLPQSMGPDPYVQNQHYPAVGASPGTVELQGQPITTAHELPGHGYRA
jgi:hypothetical protein